MKPALFLLLLAAAAQASYSRFPTGGGATGPTGSAGAGIAIGAAVGRPSCDGTQEGNIYAIQAISGTTDNLSVCLKSAADTFSWRTIVTGG